MFFETIYKHITPQNDSIAIYDSELTSYTYSQLYQQINNVEKLYNSKNLEKGSLLILHFDKSFNGLAHLLCCIKMGIIYIPVDANIPKNRLEKIKKSSQANAIVNPDFTITKTHQNLIPIHNKSCCVLYTSGSTGSPKGVIISKESLVAFVNWSNKEFKINSTDILTSYAPFHFDLSTFDIFVGLQSGSSIWLINKMLASNFRLLSEYTQQLNPTVWYATPTVYHLLNQYGNLNSSYQPKLALFAGEIFPLNNLNSLRNKWKSTTFYNLYGPTETNVCTYYKLPQEIEIQKKETHPIGSACSFAKVKILENGELLIGGKSLMLGYLNEPQLTSEKFIEIDNEKWLKSGDIVKLKNKLIHYISRNDRMIKRNGYRIELAEIENELLSHPNIKNAVCIWNNNKLITFYTGNKTSLIEFKTFCSKQLLNYMIPDKFIQITELPTNSNGKIDYTYLINNFNE